MNLDPKDVEMKDLPASKEEVKVANVVNPIYAGINCPKI